MTSIIHQHHILKLGIRHRQYLVLVLRYWCFGQYWYWYWKSQISKYWYWYWKTDSVGIGIGIGIDLKKYSFHRLQQISKINIKTPIALWTKARESAGCVFFRIALLVWSQIFVFRDLLLRMSMNGANFWSGSPQRPSALITKGFSLSRPLPD